MGYAMKATEEFTKNIEDRHPGKYTITGDYKGLDKPIEVIYNECGHKGYPLAHSLWKGCNCGKCYGTANKSHEEFVEMIEQLYPNKYDILGRYTKSSERIKVKYNECGHIAEPKAAYLRQGAGCPICHRGTKITQDEFLERFYDVADDSYEPQEQYKNHNQKMKILHKTCGTIFDLYVGNLFRIGCRCPKCYPESAVLLVPGVNDIHTTNPEMESLLKYPEDAYTHTQHTKEKLWFNCPYCGSELLKRGTNVAENGLNCPNCNTNYSYGERFISNMLSELHVKYTYQFSPDWIKPYLFDFEFVYNDNKYIIEVDGGWHFQENNKSNISLQEVIERDKYKQKIAEEHGYKVIRLNYNYKSCDDKSMFLIHSIAESELFDIFDLSDFDFKPIIEKSSIPMIKIVADLWNSYEEKAAQKIQKELNIENDDKVRKLLYAAYELKMIAESPDEIKRLNRRYGNKIYGHPSAQKVKCIETGEIFNSFKEANNKYNSNLNHYFSRNQKYSGTLPDGTKLTWQKINQ